MTTDSTEASNAATNTGETHSRVTKNGHHLHAGHPLSERTIRALAAAHLGAFDVLRVLEVHQ